MKRHVASVLCVTLIACSPSPESLPQTTQVDATPVDGTDSFRVRNDEIRGDMIRMLDEAGILYSIEDDAIVYNLADGEAIDRIGNEAISEYITRN